MDNIIEVSVLTGVWISKVYLSVLHFESLIIINKLREAKGVGV